MSISHSWKALLGLFLGCLGWQIALSYEGFRDAIGDPKGIGGLTFVFPLALWLTAIAQSYRHDWGLWRPFLVALVPCVAFSLMNPGSFHMGDALIHWIPYLVIAFIGEGAGKVVRLFTDDNGRLRHLGSVPAGGDAPGGTVHR
ncbi:hypothetical protein I6B53_06905 [Schaalia sp. 19OD2882]|uniref:hypothetical protein n=1 Tax=Schaalia sp. 19OD2882 TaxID=2794089 RepID=UPI001C1ED1AD|nr:hypothetical protein [Schaalia sp. 19OD2882]QWW18878.1 hypothetical protein I6B53_06905 [Schaalia sp. 19OD2882]